MANNFMQQWEKRVLNRNGHRKEAQKVVGVVAGRCNFFPRKSGGGLSEQKATLKKEYKYRSERKNPEKPTN